MADEKEIKNVRTRIWITDKDIADAIGRYLKQNLVQDINDLHHIISNLKQELRMSDNLIKDLNKRLLKLEKEANVRGWGGKKKDIENEIKK